MDEQRDLWVMDGRLDEGLMRLDGMAARKMDG
jgi:hypothetical protein